MLKLTNLTDIDPLHLIKGELALLNELLQSQHLGAVERVPPTEPNHKTTMIGSSYNY